MKRLLLITTSYPNGSDGKAAAGTFVQDLARLLVKQGISVEVVAPSLSKQIAKENGVDVRRFIVPSLPLSLLNPAFPHNWRAIVTTLSSGLSAVLEACESERPDHILALWTLPCGAWAQHASRKYQIPYSTWALGSDIWSLGRIPIVRTILFRVLRNARFCFADGYALAEQVHAISNRSCQFLPSCRLSAQTPSGQMREAGPYRLAYLGRWHPNKGIDILCEALHMLDSNLWQNIESIRICGGGPLENVVNEKTASLISSGKPIEIHGYLDRIEAAELYEWADYVLLPSRIESIPIVFSDAMTFHRPVVATPVGDLPHLLSEYGVGELAEEVTSSAYAIALNRILQRSPSEFKDNLQRATADFDIEKSATTLLGYMKSISTQ